MLVIAIIAFQNFMVMIESWLEEEENWKKPRETKLICIIYTGVKTII